MKRKKYPPLPDLDAPPRSKLNPPVRRYLPIHVVPKPDGSYALCGEWVLYRPSQTLNVELGALRPDGSRIQLDEIELEAGWIGNIVRHPEGPRVTDLCRACLEKVAKLRDKAARPTREKAEKLETAQERKAARERRKLEVAEAAAEAKQAREQKRQAAWEARMLAADD
jgi:hypothetical protein